MSKSVSKVRLAGSVGLLACGAGVFGDSEVEGGIISLSASPTTIPYIPNGGPTTVTLTPLGAAFIQFNNSLGKSLLSAGGFSWANVTQGQRIDAALPFGFVTNSPSAGGDTLFAFRVNNHYGWIKQNLGGIGGAITFISGAYNDGTDLANDYIDAGTLNGSGSGGGFAAVPEPGSVGLMGLATLAVGATALRRRRAAAAAAETVSAG